jgi:hypothetical protein
MEQNRRQRVQSGAADQIKECVHLKLLFSGRDETSSI